jgi:hypothetical protein
MLYHGSPQNIKGKYLLPRPSGVINNENAVFATNNYHIASLFSAKWTDLDFEFGFHNKKLFVIEQYPNAFDKLKKRAWIYSVDKDLFKTDPRLGLQGFEFISYKKVPILQKTYVRNIFKEVNKKKSPINLITFEEKIKAIEPLLKKKFDK